MTDTTIDILAQELQNKENRITKLREKLLEQQEHLKYKIKRINELSDLASRYKKDFEAVENDCGEYLRQNDDLEKRIDQKLLENDHLKTRIKGQDLELSYSRGEHPLQKAADRKRKKPNGKSKGTNIN